ncbi:MAG: 3-hydroxyacyl-CoA dehydrogenase family protein [Rhodoplanes sp.]|uniref:3-hydroxyacyl-CoA dehydrogenase family protein n=1 Tax=Rhodoplanes sp. TaxID=1968906 RepID=UPI0018453F1F|nr:3-hydroxyacyl-CoA dehydrogenase NAD-binding domain-containing protein [Rhodoplanes sp.]NVO13084.1 3-hydroxyacyl-CoA dehydrogenase family protein [Rhodoplanes sp.]
MSTEATRPADRAVGVIGAGRMGVGIAQIFAAGGFRVHLVDPIDDARAKVPERLAAITARRRQAADVVDRVSLHATAPAEIAGCVLVIEAAPETVELKQRIFRDLDARCGPEVVLATNTSVIPVSRVATDVRHPGRVLGMHFWNPPYAVRLVEVIQAERTDPALIAPAMALLAEVGQKPVHVRKDVPGFIGNRLQHALKREAIALVENGVCDAETVDFVVKNSFGARLGLMGPLEQSDLVGLGLTLAIHSVLLSDLDCSRAPQRLLVDKVAAGETGAAVGRGFRDWTPEARAELENRLDAALLDAAGGSGETKNTG